MVKQLFPYIMDYTHFWPRLSSKSLTHVFEHIHSHKLQRGSDSTPLQGGAVTHIDRQPQGQSEATRYTCQPPFTFHGNGVLIHSSEQWSGLTILPLPLPLPLPHPHSHPLPP